jgi:hypothetical protein
VFRECARAQRHGDDSAAVDCLSRFIEDFSTSPLVRSAHLQRMRALVRLGRDADARRTAATYLTEYPEGWGGDEARRVLEEGEP